MTPEDILKGLINEIEQETPIKKAKFDISDPVKSKDIAAPVQAPPTPETFFESVVNAPGRLKRGLMTGGPAFGVGVGETMKSASQLIDAAGPQKQGASLIEGFETPATMGERVLGNEQIFPDLSVRKEASTLLRTSGQEIVNYNTEQIMKGMEKGDAESSIFKGAQSAVSSLLHLTTGGTAGAKLVGKGAGMLPGFLTSLYATTVGSDIQNFQQQGFSLPEATKKANINGLAEVIPELFLGGEYQLFSGAVRGLKGVVNTYIKELGQEGVTFFIQKGNQLYADYEKSNSGGSFQQFAAKKLLPYKMNEDGRLTENPEFKQFLGEMVDLAKVVGVSTALMGGLTQSAQRIADSQIQSQEQLFEGEAIAKQEEFIRKADEIAERESKGNPAIKEQIMAEMQEDFINSQEKAEQENRKNRFLEATGQQTEQKGIIETLKENLAQKVKKVTGVTEQDQKGQQEMERLEREREISDIETQFRASQIQQAETRAKEDTQSFEKGLTENLTEINKVTENYDANQVVNEQESQQALNDLITEIEAEEKGVQEPVTENVPQTPAVTEEKIPVVGEQQSFERAVEPIKGKKITAVELKQQIQKEFKNLNESQIEAGMALLEARAESAGETLDEYIGRRIAGVKPGSELKGDALKQAAENSPEFKKWFGESKVVDEQGKPLVVTHMTDAKGITEFRKGRGIWFGDKEAQESYEYKENFDDPQAYDVFVSLKNPLTSNEVSFYPEDEESGGYLGNVTDSAYSEEWVKEMQKKGYDGIFYEEEGIGRTIVAFDPNQIKSVNNEGTFNPLDPNILKQENKAAIQFGNDARATIFAFKKADVSSLAHEIGHIFRRDVTGNDLKVMEDFAGVKNGQWKTSNEEKFARAFEKYLRDGQAPTSKLVEVFNKFRNWLTNIYKKIKGTPLNMEISAPVRKVFDNLLTPGKAITPKKIDVQKVQGELSFPKTATAAGAVSAETQNSLLTRYDTSYNVLTNVESFEKASSRNRTPEAVVESMRNNKNPDAVDMVEAQIALTQLERQGRHNEAADLIFATSEKAKNYGQAIQALSMINKLSPEGALLYAQKLLFQAGVNTKLTASQIKDITDAAVMANRAGKSKVLSMDLSQSTITDIFDKRKKNLALALVNSLKTKKVTGKEAQFVNSIVATLKSQLGEHLPPTPERNTLSAMEKMIKGIENPDMFFEVWNDAAAKAAEKYPDAADFMESLNPKAYEDKNLSRATKDLVKEFTDSFYKTLLEGKELNLRRGINESIAKMDVSTGTKGILAELIWQEFNRQANSLKTKGIENILKKEKLNIKNLKTMYVLGLLDTQERMAKFSEKLGVKNLSEELVRQIEAGFGKDSVTDSVRISKAAQVMDVIARIPGMDKPSFGRKVGLVHTMMMLLNTVTQIRNVVGNGTMSIANIVKDVGVLPLDAMTSIVTGKRTKRTFASLGARARGLYQPVQDIVDGYSFSRSVPGGSKSILQSMKDGIDTLTILSKVSTRGKYEESDMKAMLLNTFENKPMRALEDLLTLTLGAPDRAFWYSAFEAEMKNQVKLSETDPDITPDRMVEQATIMANKATFQDDNFLSNNLPKLKRGMNTISSLGLSPDFGAGDAIIKFTRVPGSILLQGMEWSPLGFARNLYSAFTPFFRKVGLKGLADHSAQNQREFIETFSKATLGTAAPVLLGYWLFMKGIISGDRDEKKEIAYLQQKQGFQANSINWNGLKWLLSTGSFFNDKVYEPQEGDVVRSYDWMQPLAIPIAMGAAFAKDRQKFLKVWGTNKPVDLTDTLALMMKTSFNLIQKQPLMMGMERFAQDISYAKKEDTLSGWGSALAKQYENIVIGFVPSNLNKIGQLGDNLKREIKASTKSQEFINKIISRTPWAKDNLPVKIDSYGEIMERYQGGTNTWYNVMGNPAFTRTIKRDRLSQELLRIYEATGEVSHIPKDVKRSVTINVTGEKGGAVQKKLTTQEIVDYQYAVGKVTVNLFNGYLRSEDFLTSPVEVQSKIMAATIRDVGEVAKMRLFGHRASLGKKMTNLRLLYNGDLQGYVNKRIWDRERL